MVLSISCSGITHLLCLICQHGAVVNITAALCFCTQALLRYIKDKTWNISMAMSPGEWIFRHICQKYFWSSEWKVVHSHGKADVWKCRHWLSHASILKSYACNSHIKWMKKYPKQHPSHSKITLQPNARTRSSVPEVWNCGHAYTGKTSRPNKTQIKDHLSSQLNLVYQTIYMDNPSHSYQWNKIQALTTELKDFTIRKLQEVIHIKRLQTSINHDDGYDNPKHNSGEWTNATVQSYIVQKIWAHNTAQYHVVNIYNTQHTKYSCTSWISACPHYV